MRRGNQALRWTAGIGAFLTFIGSSSANTAFGLRALLIGIGLLGMTAYVLWRRWFGPRGYVRRGVAAVASE